MNKQGNVLVVILVIVATVALAIAGYFFFQNQNLQKSFDSAQDVSPTPIPVVKDEITGWKTYTNNDLTFKYPPSWKVSNGNRTIESLVPNIKMDIVSTDGTLVNECMHQDNIKVENKVIAKFFSKINTDVGMCASGVNPNAKEVWIIPSESSYAPGVTIGYSAMEEDKALPIIDQILGTFRFID